MHKILTTLIVLTFAAPALADIPEIVAVNSTATNGTWQFDVTLRHSDTGWTHYANRWAIFTPDGTKLGTRVLAHPHVNEQPFTRSLGGVTIPDSIDHVILRPHDLVHGDGPDFKHALK